MARTHTRAAAALLLLAGCLAHRGVATPPGHPLAPAGVVALALTPVSEPGSLAALQGRTVNVRDFGAAGDGVADDGAAINAAIEAAAVGGGVVFFPAGTYSVGSSVRSPVAGFLNGTFVELQVGRGAGGSRVRDRHSREGWRPVQPGRRAHRPRLPGGRRLARRDPGPPDRPERRQQPDARRAPPERPRDPVPERRRRRPHRERHGAEQPWAQRHRGQRARAGAGRGGVHPPKRGPLRHRARERPQHGLQLRLLGVVGHERRGQPHRAGGAGRRAAGVLGRGSSCTAATRARCATC